MDLEEAKGKMIVKEGNKGEDFEHEAPHDPLGLLEDIDDVVDDVLLFAYFLLL